MSSYQGDESAPLLSPTHPDLYDSHGVATTPPPASLESSEADDSSAQLLSSVDAWARSLNTKAVVFCAAAGIESVASPMLSKAAVPFYSEIICCKHDARKCRSESWCDGSDEVQDELAVIINYTTSTSALWQILALIIWSAVWSFSGSSSSSSRSTSPPRDVFRALMLAKSSTWLTEALRPLLAELCILGFLSLKWVWIAPIAYIFIGGGNITYVWLQNGVVAGIERDERLLTFLVLHCFPTLGRGLGHVITGLILKFSTPLLSIIAGLVILLSELVVLWCYFPRLDPPAQSTPTTAGGQGDRSSVLLRTWQTSSSFILHISQALSSAKQGPLFNPRLRFLRFTLPILGSTLAYNPLATSLEQFAIQYIPVRYPPTTKTMAVWIEGCGVFFGLLPLLISRVTKKVVPLAVLYLAVATIASIVMSYASNIWIFSSAMALAYTGAGYVPMIKEALSSQFPADSHMAIFMLFQLFEALGRFIIGILLPDFFRDEREGGSAGSVYSKVTCFCLGGCALLFLGYLNLPEQPSQADPAEVDAHHNDGAR